MTNPSKIEKILCLIEKAYGKTRAFRKTPPVDELVRTILSQNTNDRNSLAAFAALKRRFRGWEELSRSDVDRIAGAIRHAGLANIKARRIKKAIDEIKRREGRISLAGLGRMKTDDALSYLGSLEGVGPKTASCVLLFSFGKPVMPVDTHIFRVAKRLGLIAGDINIEEAHRALTAATPKKLIYRFHLCIIEHGRRTCKAQNPRCGSCILYGMCGFKDKRKYKK